MKSNPRLAKIYVTTISINCFESVYHYVSSNGHCYIKWRAPYGESPKGSFGPYLFPQIRHWNNGWVIASATPGLSGFSTMSHLPPDEKETYKDYNTTKTSIKQNSMAQNKEKMRHCHFWKSSGFFFDLNFKNKRPLSGLKTSQVCGQYKMTGINVFPLSFSTH